MLKSVYFGSMEFKALFYILIAVIWFFSKVLNAKGKKVKKALPMPPPANPLPPAPVKPVRKKVEVRATKRPTMVVNQPVSLESQSGLEAAAVNRLNTKVRESRLPEPVLMEVQMLEDDGWQENGSFGVQLASEIKNGTIDWKRAVVINELLSPRV